MLHRTRTLAVSILISLFTLSCGGGGGGGGGETPPAAPSASLSYGIKTLEFTWPAVAGATHYRLLENPDGVSGFTQVGSDITTTSVSHTIALHRRVNASYIVAACNSGGCTNSTPITLAANLVPAIGYVKASNTGVGDRFGKIVALSADGNTLAVGAPYEGSNAQGIDGDQVDNSAGSSGAVYVFTRSGSVWTQQAYVKASNAGAGDTFGIALALSADGNTLAVGAAQEDSNATGIDGNEADNSFVNSGAVYVFIRSGSTWTQQAYVKASNTGAGDYFGAALALAADGNTLAVGAPYEDSNATNIGGDPSNNSATDAGAVYLFTRSSSTWAQQAYVKASNTGANDAFGFALALSADGEALAVGAYGEDSNANLVGGNQADNSSAESGAAYVFVRTGNSWAQQAYVKASNNEVGPWFGSDIAISGDGNTLVVGAVEELGVSDGIEIFIRSGSTWIHQAYVSSPNGRSGDSFGSALALSVDGNTLTVGAPGEDSSAIGIGGNQADNSSAGSGAAYVYVRTGNSWAQQAYVKASNTEANDGFGTSISLSADGGTLVVGAVGEASAATGIGGNQADNSATNSGAVYLY